MSRMEKRVKEKEKKKMKMDIESYKESLIGGLNGPEEAEEEIAEIKAAKVGTIKPDCWQKVSDTEIELYEL